MAAAALIWVPCLHFFFTQRASDFYQPEKLSPKASQLAARHLELWTNPQLRERELKKTLSMLGKKLGPEEAKVIEHLSFAIVEGVLSTPMNNLRKEIEESENEELTKIVAKLFKYEEKQ